MGESPSQTKCVMENKSQKQSVLVSIRRSKDALYVSNDKGNEWKFPKGMSERVAVASLVYGAMMGRKDEMDCFCDHYRVTIEVERLDV
jgi:hypothetical protein